jgi:hypothetical protein
VSDNIVKSLSVKAQKLTEEMIVLKKIIKSNRTHFNELEKADFDALQEQ